MEKVQAKKRASKGARSARHGCECCECGLELGQPALDKISGEPFLVKGPLGMPLSFIEAPGGVLFDVSLAVMHVLHGAAHGVLTEAEGAAYISRVSGHAPGEEEVRLAAEVLQQLIIALASKNRMGDHARELMKPLAEAAKGRSGPGEELPALEFACKGALEHARSHRFTLSKMSALSPVDMAEIEGLRLSNLRLWLRDWLPEDKLKNAQDIIDCALDRKWGVRKLTTHIHHLAGLSDSVQSKDAVRVARKRKSLRAMHGSE